MKKIAASLAALGGLVSALPAFALDIPAGDIPKLGTQINSNLAYGQITGLGTRDIREVIMTIINVIFGFIAAIFVAILALGIFQYMTAGGSEDKTGAAKNYIIGAIVGLAVMFVSYAVALFVVRSLVNVAA